MEEGNRRIRQPSTPRTTSKTIENAKPLQNNEIANTL